MFVVKFSETTCYENNKQLYIKYDDVDHHCSLYKLISKNKETNLYKISKDFLRYQYILINNDYFPIWYQELQENPDLKERNRVLNNIFRRCSMTLHKLLTVLNKITWLKNPPYYFNATIIKARYAKYDDANYILICLTNYNTIYSFIYSFD